MAQTTVPTPVQVDASTAPAPASGPDCIDSLCPLLHQQPLPLPTALIASKASAPDPCRTNNPCPSPCCINSLCPLLHQKPLPQTLVVPTTPAPALVASTASAPYCIKSPCPKPLSYQQPLPQPLLHQQPLPRIASRAPAPVPHCTNSPWPRPLLYQQPPTLPLPHIASTAPTLTNGEMTLREPAACADSCHLRCWNS